MRKWTYELIIVAVLVCIGLGIWWFVSTKGQRQTDAQFEQLVKFANRQQVEIAIIKQAVELRQLRAAIQRVQEAVPSSVMPQPPKMVDPNLEWYNEK